MATSALERELKRGSTEVLILSLLEHRQRHGYEIGQLIAERSQGAISFHIASLYPTLYRLESRDSSRGDGWRKRVNAGAATTAFPQRAGNCSPRSGAPGGPS